MSPKIRRPPPQAAFCEDLDEDANTILPETRKVANVAAKRSKPELQTKKGSADGWSDSGYSSHTAATVGSGDSAPKDKKQPVALKLDTGVKERESRPYTSERRGENNESRQSSTRPVLQRSTSKSRPHDKRRHPPGTCRECDYYGYHVATPVEAPRGYEFPPIPPSPQSARYAPQMFAQEIHTTQPTAAQPRISRSQSYRQAGRPMSMHAGMMTEPLYVAIPQAPPVFDYRPPPLSVSAWANPPTSYAPSAYAPTPQTYVQPPVNVVPQRLDPPPPSPYEQHRPAPRSRPSETKTIRRSSMYGTPVVQHAEPVYNAPSLERRVSQKERRPAPPPDPRHDRDEDFYRMPPPQKIPIRTRPPPRKSMTTNSTPITRRPVDVDHSDTRAEVSDRNVRRGSKESTSSDQRPSLVQPDGGRKTVSYSDRTGSAKTAVENGMHRRTTVDGHERPKDLEQKQLEIEAYQIARGSKPVPLTADALKTARRSNKSSDSASQKSFTSSSKGSDVRTKSGSGIASRNEKDFTMTIDGVKLGFSGDSVEDKRINIRQGGLELSIEGKTTKKYTIIGKEPAPGLSKREIESGRRSRDEYGSDRASRRSSRSGYSVRAFEG